MTSELQRVCQPLEGYGFFKIDNGLGGTAGMTQVFSRRFLTADGARVTPFARSSCELNGHKS
ncbi:MAG TPA: hypothetical protein VGE96_07250 [Steroidobacteraceae bacterium]